MLELKRVEDHDLNILTDIKKRAFEAEFKKYGFTPDEMISIEWHKKMMNDSIYYTIINDREIVGGVNIFGGDNGEYYLCCIFIDSELQNTGLGTQTINLLEEIHDDSTKWVLDTPSMSVQNHHFYEKCGYKHVNDIIPNEAPEGFSLRVYEKIIG